MTKRIGRRVSFASGSLAPPAPAPTPSVSEDGSLDLSPYRSHKSSSSAYAQDEATATTGTTLRTKLSILVVAAGLTGGYVWFKTKDSSPERAKQYAFIAAGGVAGIVGYALFIKGMLG